MALGYVVADALVHEHGVRSRVAALWPYLAVVAAWRMTGAYLGIGAQASGLYLEPSVDPLGFVTAALLQTPALAFSLAIASSSSVPSSTSSRSAPMAGRCRSA